VAHAALKLRRHRVPGARLGEFVPPGSEARQVLWVDEGGEGPAEEDLAGLVETRLPGGVDLQEAALEVGDAEKVGSELEELLVLAGQEGLLGGELAALQQRGDHRDDAGKAALEDAVGCAMLEAVDRGFLIQGVGEYHHGGVAASFPDQGEHRQDVTFLETVVGDDQIRAELVQGRA